MAPRPAITLALCVACTSSCANSSVLDSIGGAAGGSADGGSSGGSGGSSAGASGASGKSGTGGAAGGGAGTESGGVGGAAGAGGAGATAGGGGTAGAGGDSAAAGAAGEDGGAADSSAGSSGIGGVGGSSGASGGGSAGVSGGGGVSGGAGSSGADAGDGGALAAVSCRQLKNDAPSSSSGIYSIDADGVGAGAAHDIYCDMVTDGGGWALVTVSLSTDPDSVPFIGSAYCTTLDTTVACKGRMPVAHVSTTNELLFFGLESSRWAVLNGFSATSQSKIRFITGELPISTTSTWTRNGDLTTDPSSMVVRTSGYTVNAVFPLRHYIRQGGWWLGNGALAGFVPGGRLIAINYGGTQDLSELLDPSGYATPFPVEHMALFYR